MRNISANGALLFAAGTFFVGIFISKHLTLNPVWQHPLTVERSQLEPVATDTAAQQGEGPNYNIANSGSRYSNEQDPVSLPPGKELRYIPISSECRIPTFLEGYGQNLCWNKPNNSRSSLVKVTCAPSLVLLGVHKSGTRDLLFAMNNIGSVKALFYEPLAHLQTIKCPTEYFESGRDSRADKARPGLARMGKYLSINTGEAFRRAYLHADNEDHYLITSVVQYLSFFNPGNMRFLMTLRNPTDRFISNYFFMYETKAFKKMPIFRGHKSVESIGNEFFHDVVVRTINHIWKCLEHHGVSGCIFLKTDSGDRAQDQMIVMLTHGCYYVFLEQIFSFVPRDKLYISMLEQYSANKGVELQKIFDFWGLDPDKRHEARNEAAKQRHGAKVGKPMLQKTKDLLDKFYEPFNIKLSELLTDDKWLWKRH